jgi:hypothetical protein
MKKFALIILGLLTATAITASANTLVPSANTLVKVACGAVAGGVIVKATMTPGATNAPVATATNAPAVKAVVVVPVAPAVKAVVFVPVAPAVKAVTADPVAERAALVKELEGTTSSSRRMFGSLGGSSGGSSNPSVLREEQEGPQRVLAARGFLATQAGGKVMAALTALGVSERQFKQVLVEHYSSTTLKGWCDLKGEISPAELAELRLKLAEASLYRDRERSTVSR